MATALGYSRIYLHLVDLEVSHDRMYESRSGRVMSVSTAISPSRLLPISPLQHWAIQVRDRCYEVTEDEEGVLIGGEPQHDMYIVPAGDWIARCEGKGLKRKTIIVGATTHDDDFIRKQADLIWDSRFQLQYKVGSQNCQNFAYLLHGRICMSREELAQIPWSERSNWKRMPNRLTQLTTLGKKLGPYLTLGVGIDALTMNVAKTNPAVSALTGGAIFATLIIPILFLHSKDRKWKKQIKKADKILASHEFAKGKGEKHYNVDPYQQYNKECVDTFARKAGCEVDEVVWALQCFQVPTFDGKPFFLSVDDENLLIEVLQAGSG